jgi:YVTN family beta-propeller protein
MTTAMKKLTTATVVSRKSTFVTRKPSPILPFSHSLFFFLAFFLLKFHAHAQTAYITNNGDSSVSVINVATNTVTATIHIGSEPWGVSVSPDGSKVYVANNDYINTVNVIKTSTNTIVATITVGSWPDGIFVSPDGSKVYVANTDSNTVSVINTASNIVSATFPILAPYGVTESPDGSKVYITNYAYPGSINVINAATNTVTDTIPVGILPSGIAVSPDGSKVYVVNSNSNTVSVINTSTDTVTATIPVGSFPNCVSVSTDGSKVYVVNSGTFDDIGNTVSVINSSTNTVTATIPVGSFPQGVSVSPDGSKIYVANEDSNTVSVINTATDIIMATIPVGKYPVAFGNFISIYPNTGIAPQSMMAAGIDIFPNPASGEIRVIGNQCSVSGVEVFNLLGEKIYTSPITDNRAPITINVADFPNGVYVVKVRTEKGMEVSKFIKE